MTKGDRESGLVDVIVGMVDDLSVDEIVTIVEGCLNALDALEKNPKKDICEVISKEIDEELSAFLSAAKVKKQIHSCITKELNKKFDNSCFIDALVQSATNTITADSRLINEHINKEISESINSLFDGDRNPQLQQILLGKIHQLVDKELLEGDCIKDAIEAYDFDYSDEVSEKIDEAIEDYIKAYSTLRIKSKEFQEELRKITDKRLEETLKNMSVSIEFD